MDHILLKLPESPGVYLMKDSAGHILYIGKAKNLKKRVSSYFSPNRDSREHIPFLIQKVSDIETISVHNETEALLLENNLIKRHAPRYNILLKDDKTFFCLTINTNQKWPKLSLTRTKALPSSTKGLYFFGPYVNSEACKKLLDLMRDFFPLRTCSDAELKSRKRPCVLYDMKKCLAPCVQLCSEEHYATVLKEAILFLSGKKTEVLRLLEKELLQASNSLEFEKAAIIHRTLTLVKKSLEDQRVECYGRANTDVIGLYRNEHYAVITILLIRSGKLLDAVHYSFSETAENDAELVSSFILQYYKKAPEFPEEILSPVALDATHTLKEVLSSFNSLYRPPKILFPRRGVKKQLLDLAHQNAQSFYSSKKSEDSLLLQLQNLCFLSKTPNVIECYDNAHIHGVHATGGFITVKKGVFERSLYRTFSFADSFIEDDLHLLELSLTKRLQLDLPLPQLILIDGGKSHFLRAKAILQRFQINIDLLCLSKEKGNHSKSLLNEKIFCDRYPSGLLLKNSSSLLHLLQRIRDEAHRFIISFHRRLRSNKTLALQMKIPRIGPKKTKLLLRNFFSPQGVLTASPETLKEIPGLNSRDIQAILRWQEIQKDS